MLAPTYMQKHTYIQNTCQSKKIISCNLCSHNLKRKNKVLLLSWRTHHRQAFSVVSIFPDPNPHIVLWKEKPGMSRIPDTAHDSRLQSQRRTLGRGQRNFERGKRTKRNLENGTEEYDRNRQKGEKEKKKETSRLGNGIETEGKQGHCSASPWTKAGGNTEPLGCPGVSLSFPCVSQTQCEESTRLRNQSSVS